jgi:2-polyprenyl-6-hydroxyphenyl methylase/3-demethylubiquinone-9 3-methyltransferase
MNSVADACIAVKKELANSRSADDLAYFDLHERRFRDTASRVAELVPPNGRILDVGSHYLHLSSILTLLGYRVVSMDVPAHSTLPFVSERAERMGIPLAVVDGDAIAEGRFLVTEADSFDAVLFCEILEHITFNPISYWRRIHELLRPNGIIYLTTPNSLKLLAVLGALWNLVTLRRIGLSVKQIMRRATLGHHWKEYSAREIREYFAFLSPDFRVRVRRVDHYGSPPEDLRRELGSLRSAILRVGNATRFFAEGLEAVISLPAKTTWTRSEPRAG